MTEQMRAFLLAFAGLMKVHGIEEVEAVDDGKQFHPSVDGVEFSMGTRWDKDGNVVRECCRVKLNRFFTATDIVGMVEKEETP